MKKEISLAHNKFTVSLDDLNVMHINLQSDCGETSMVVYNMTCKEMTRLASWLNEQVSDIKNTTKEDDLLKLHD